MDLCHQKNSELEPTFQQFFGGVVLRGESVKDDSGSHAVSTEQGSSVSQMTAATVLDIVSRLTGCAGQSFHSSKNGGRLQHCSKFPSQSVQIFGNDYRNTDGPNRGPVWKTQSFASHGTGTVNL